MLSVGGSVYFDIFGRRQMSNFQLKNKILITIFIAYSQTTTQKCNSY